MTYLLDVNIWIALTVAEHVQHISARNWLEETSSETLAFCRVTQMGFLRLLTNPAVMKGDTLTARQAWHLIERWLQNERIVFAAEPTGIDEAWKKITGVHGTGANFWTDTYLAAFALKSGYTLVTFDKGFRKHGHLPIRILSATLN